MQSLNGKTAFITGGSKGIGFAVAARLVRSGANTLIFARGEERLREAVEELRALKTADTQVVSGMILDVSKSDEAAAVLERAVGDFGAPALLINTAGTAYPEYFERIPEEKFRLMLDTNLSGPWNVTQVLVPFMKQEGGTIVFVSSVAGFIGTFGYSAYSATKFGIIGLAETLRSELSAWNIRVAVLCPPDTDTPGFKEENRTKPYETKVMSESLSIMSPDAVAAALMRGLKRRRFMIIPGFMSRLSWLLKRFAPGLIFRIIDGDIRKARRQLARVRQEKTPADGRTQEKDE